MKRTEFANLTLVAQEDLNNLAQYYIQALKERFYAATIGYDPGTATDTVYNGIVKEPDSLRFSGTDGTTYTSPTITLTSGAAFTRFDPTSLTSSTQYIGGERVALTASQVITLTNTSPGNYYFFLVYVDLRKNKKFDESGVNAYFVDHPENWIIVQMTQTQATTLGSYGSNPTGSVVVSNISAPQLDALLSNEEKSATFGAWTYISGVFTITSFTVTHYNSIFLGEVIVTNSVGPQYQFWHTIQGGDPLVGIQSRRAFSIVDEFHRSQLGRGTESSSNPHAMLLQDLGGYTGTIEEHRLLDHSNGIAPSSGSATFPDKYTTSGECFSNDSVTPKRIDITQIVAGDYLFIDGKRVTSFSNTTVPISGFTVGINYIYASVTGSVTTSSTAPYEYYSASVQAATSIPSSNAFVLCSVYYNGTQAYAYNGDPRFTNGNSANPVTDLRVFGVEGYNALQSIVFESINKENMIPNGTMQIAENGLIRGWHVGTQATISSATPPASSGSASLAIASSDYTILFPFDANVDYAFRAKFQSAGSATITVTLRLYRGKDQNQDSIGTFVLYNNTETDSSWTLRESEFLSSSAIVFSGVLADRNYVGWARLEIATTSALNVCDVVLRPKIRTFDISNQMITTTKIQDGSVTTVKIPSNAITTALINSGAITNRTLNASGGDTSIASLVSGVNADALHSHSVGTGNIIIAFGGNGLSIVTPSSGTFLLEAFMSCSLSFSDNSSVTLLINGAGVSSLPTGYGIGGRVSETLFYGHIYSGIGPGTIFTATVAPGSNGVDSITMYLKLTKLA